VEVVVEPALGVDATLERAASRLLGQLSATAVFDPDLLARAVGGPSATLLVARIDHDIVGLLVVSVVPTLSGVRAHLDDVVVDQAFRGRGVGEALVRAALDHARAGGARSIELTSRQERQAAIRLYERIGFRRRDTGVFRLDLGR
jgi:ribosomal protein S18 acetylase RimI-like enzyme